MNCFRTIRRPVLAGLVLGCLTWFAGLAYPAESSPKKLVTIEGITEYRLGNGLRILLFPDDSSSTVTVNLTVFVGSRHEGYGETGMAHLLEHMLFKGTPRHKDIPKLLRDHGADFNGTTWLDRTNYYETMPASPANLEFGIRLEGDRLVNSFINREDLVNEMPVVRNEFEMGENKPEYILSQRMMAVAYEWHNYGKSTIGNRSDIERVPIDRLQAFYKKYYRPDNAMLTVAGRFDPDKALGFITKYFGRLRRPAQKIDPTYTDEPTQDGERRVVLRRAGKIGMVGVIYHIPAGSHPDFPAVEALNSILVSDVSGRLYKALVETKKATKVNGGALALHDPGVIEITAQVNPKDSLTAVRDTMVPLLEKLGKEKITAEEVGRAKRQFAAERDLLMRNSKKLCIELSEWAAQGDWRLFFLHRDRVAKVTPEDVQRVAAAYLKASNRTIGLFIPTEAPERSKIPATPDVAALVKDYKGGEAVAAGEAFEPTPANIEKRVRRSQLPGGLKLALLSKKSRGKAVVVDLRLHYGNAKSLNGNTSATQFLGEMMFRGTKKHTRLEISDAFDQLSADVKAGGQTGDLQFMVVTKRESLPAVLELLGECLRQPTFPADEFDLLKRQIRAGLQKQMVEPEPRAFRLLQRKLNPYPKEDVRYVPTFQESLARLKAVTRDQLVKIYKEQLGAQAGELAIVGDFDPVAMKSQVQKLLGDWKASVTYERIPRPAVAGVKGGKETILTPDKANAMYIAGMKFPMRDTHPDYPALRVASYLFGEGSLSSRLGESVRKKEGSYQVGSDCGADARDNAGRFLMFATCKPINMPRVDKAMMAELEKLLKKGVAPDELEDGKKAYLEELKVGRSEDQNLAAILAEDLILGRTFAFQAEREKKIAALTPEEVLKAVQKHIDPKKLVIIEAGDFKKKAEAKKETAEKGK
jgi:zinc protease